MPSTETPLLTISNLRISVPQQRRPDTALVDGVSLQLNAGEIIGLIGETGAGKSLTAWAAVDLVQPPARISGGYVELLDTRITGRGDEALRAIRGKRVAMIVQDPRASLNPVLPIGRQVVNALTAHLRLSARDAETRALEALRAAGIPDPVRRSRSYPHQLSGGLAQRALIAMALINSPEVLVADEPTTGLDVTVQANILDTMAERVASQSLAMWLITHDLGVIANYVSRAYVMFAGQIVESAPVKQLFADARHPYTLGLVNSYGRAARKGRLRVEGPPPDLANRPTGCQFRYRCPWAEDICAERNPSLVPVSDSHAVRCWVAQRAAGIEVPH